MEELPKVRLGRSGIFVTRLISGGNPLCGNSHFSDEMNAEMSDVFQNIRILAAAGAAAIYHHGTQTDRFWLEDRIEDVHDYLKCMRDAGVQVGLGTHTPEVIEYVEEKGWDVDFYTTCFYNINRKRRQSALVSGSTASPTEEFLPEDPRRMCRVIQQTEKMCLAFKILGAFRLCSSQKEVEAA